MGFGGGGHAKKYGFKGGAAPKKKEGKGGVRRNSEIKKKKWNEVFTN